MTLDFNSLGDFRSAISDGKSVAFQKKGSWYIEGTLMRLIRRLFGRENARIASVCRVFHQQLDLLEKIPPQFRSPEGELTREHQNLFQAWIDTAQAVCEAYRKPTVNAEVRKELDQIDRKVTALKYRIELSRETDEYTETLERMIALGSEWKRSSTLYEGKDLSDLDTQKIREACGYPEFTGQLERSAGLRAEFFKWVIRYNNPVKPFVQYPGICRRLTQVYLAQRIGRFAGKHFEVEKRDAENGAQEKVLTLPFEVKEEDRLRTRRISILDEEQELTFRGGFVDSIKNVFQEFKNKELGPGEYEYFGERGIANWNSHTHSWRNEDGKPVKVSYLENNWWEQFPVFEILTKDELRTRYLLDEIPDSHWVGIVKSTAESLDLDVNGSHGYLEVAILLEDGRYQIMDFGKFAQKYPQSSLDFVTFLGNTFYASVQYPDSNEFYSQRQHAAVPYFLTPEQGMGLMREIQKTMIKAKNGNLIFQFAYENCAFWPQKVFCKIFNADTNYFFEDVLSATPSNPILKKTFKAINRAPACMQRAMFRILVVLFNPWRGVTVFKDGEPHKKSVAATSLWSTQKMWHPSYLLQQIREGKIPGIIYNGHQFETIHEATQ